jgi:bifunctional DNA-binding transcriptional regulator/antitoxin component of YhaV-PrlF toxin-antitoxin module
MVKSRPQAGRVGTSKVAHGMTRIPKEVSKVLRLRDRDFVDYTWTGEQMVLSRANGQDRTHARKT